MGQKSSVITLEVLTLIKHVHRVVLACFHVGAYILIIFWVRFFIPPTFEKAPILGGRLPPGFFQLTEPCMLETLSDVSLSEF